MSVTHTALVDAVRATMLAMGFRWSASSAPVQSKSIKAGSGSGAKVVVTLRELTETHDARGAEHANSTTTGRLVFVLKPSSASGDLNLEASAALAELGHRAVIKLDGVSGIRASLSRVTVSVNEVVVEAALVFGSVVTSTDTDDQLLGRV